MLDPEMDEALYAASVDLAIRGLVQLGYSEADCERCRTIALSRDPVALNATQLVLDLELGRYVVAFDDVEAQRSLRLRIEAGAQLGAMALLWALAASAAQLLEIAQRAPDSTVPATC
jgi:hypothetical protein